MVPPDGACSRRRQGCGGKGEDQVLRRLSRWLRINPMATYTFGDDAGAVERLALVASAYEPTSRTFLNEHAPQHAEVAIDLGCGPGFSTQLIDTVCAPRTLIGIDSSSEFIEVARPRLPSTFLTHDVTTSRLPGAPAEVLYARLVLAYLGVGRGGRWNADT